MQKKKTDQNDIGDEMISDFSAIKRWKSISQQNRDLISKNVYCSNCGVTEIKEGLTIKAVADGDIVLRGKCKTCGADVARLVERDWR